MEREQERDDFQREIHNLQAALNVRERKETAESRLQREVGEATRLFTTFYMYKYVYMFVYNVHVLCMYLRALTYMYMY